MDLAFLIPDEDDGLLTHARDKIIARVRNLALVAYKEPGSSEDLLLLLLVDLMVDEDLSANFPMIQIDKALQ